MFRRRRRGDRVQRRPVPLTLNFLYRVPPEQRRDLFAFGLENVLTQLSENALLQYVPLYVIALGASNTQIGSVPALGNLAAAAAQWPGARLVERRGHRRTIVLTTGFLARVFILSLVVLTFVPRDVGWLAYAIAGLFAGRAFFLALGQPAWTSLAADVVPDAIRGRFFALRDFIIRVSLLVMLPALGWVADHWGVPWGYRSIFLLAWVLGMIAWFSFRRVHDPAPLPAEYLKARPRRTLRQALRDERDYVMFTLANVVWNLSLTIAGPYFTVHLVRNLGGNARWVGVLAAVHSVFGLIGALYWGRIIDRKGNLPVNRITALAIPLLPWAWMLVRAPWQVVFINAYGGFMWSGFLISNFNLLLSLSPPRQRARFAAFYQTGVLLSSSVGPIVGGLLADRYSIPSTFLVSGVGRFLAALMLLGLVRRGEYTPLPPERLAQESKDSPKS